MSLYGRTTDRNLTCLENYDRPSARRIRSYAWRLVSKRSLDAHLLEFVICTLLPSAKQKLFGILSNEKEQDESGRITFSAGELAQKLLWLANSKGSDLTQDALVKYLLEGLGTKMPAVIPPPANLRQLSDMLALEPAHVEIALFLYHMATYEPIERLAWAFGLRGFLNLLSDATGIRYAVIVDATKAKGRLQATGLIDKPTPKSCPPLSLHDDVISLIGGIASETLTDKFFTRDTAPALAIERSHVPDIPKSIISSLLTRPGSANILLYGIPGTGKTEFARSIARASGRCVYQVKHPEDADADDQGLKNRRIALIATTNSVAAENSILIVDEADTFLNTLYSLFSSAKNTPDKGWLNAFLDKSRHKIIWITNESRLIEESTMRRFSYSLHFPRPNSRKRYELWNDLLKNHPMRKYIKDETIRRLSSRYTVTTGGIASALSTLERVSGNEQQSVDTVLTDLVARHARVIGVQTGSKMQPIHSVYDASILNTDTRLDQVLSSVTKASVNAPSNSWGEAYGLNLLLWGAPGTGKTAFAQHIAETTGRELLVKRASDILNPFFGMTEKKIAESFAEAFETGSILLIDEADSFLVDRRFARASWETTQTNELLCQMENFPGMLICCTNLLDRLDHAVLRRFAWKIEFKHLTPAASLKLCRKYFPEIPDWDHCSEAVGMGGLTPGDIMAVWRRSQTIGESFTTARQVIEALAAEIRYKDPALQQIGFQS